MIKTFTQKIKSEHAVEISEEDNATENKIEYEPSELSVSLIKQFSRSYNCMTIGGKKVSSILN